MSDSPVICEAEPVDQDDMFIDSLDQFMPLLQAWHQHQVATLEHMQLIPEGTDVAVEGDPPFTLTGDVMKAFQMGISISLAHLGTLPFNEYKDDTDVTQH